MTNAKRATPAPPIPTTGASCLTLCLLTTTYNLLPHSLQLPVFSLLSHYRKRVPAVLLTSCGHRWALGRNTLGCSARRKRGTNRTSRMAASTLRIALIQMAVGEVKTKNVARAVQLIKEAAGGGAQLIVLPECFNSPYGTNYFPKYAENIPGESTTALSDAAKKFGVFVVGGSVPEKDGDKIFNTCTVWGPQGNMIAKYRKIHLFDINIPGGIVFRESDSLSPGNDLTTFDLPHCKIGLGICYDMRFPELAQIYSKLGCKVVLYPGAFNMTTGPAHWELLQRSRALDNQVYVGTISPARDTNSTYIAWGHSSMVSPWGEVVSTCDEEEAIVYADMDMDYVTKVRQMIPVHNQKRSDIYEVTSK